MKGAGDSDCILKVVKFSSTLLASSEIIPVSSASFSVNLLVILVKVRVIEGLDPVMIIVLLRLLNLDGLAMLKFLVLVHGLIIALKWLIGFRYINKIQIEVNMRLILAINCHIDKLHIKNRMSVAILINARTTTGRSNRNTMILIRLLLFWTDA